ncbi:MAG: CGNR zinc finger domain-containing protein [Actinomycetota bacterium]|nr:CGNR zinc finger domain-containing protein [Actinomycetota bacterium]
MDFDHYTDCTVQLAVDLANSGTSDDGPRDNGEPEQGGPETVGELCTLLREHEVSHPGKIGRREVDDVRALRSKLRAVWQAATAEEAANLVNALLAQSQALPQLTDHDGDAWHLHFLPPGAPLAMRLQAEAGMALAGVLRADGFVRLRTCASDTCSDVFVDASRNRSRRYCDPDTCANRINVAAHRARQRAD